MVTRRVFAGRALACTAMAACVPLRGAPAEPTRKLLSRFIAPCCWSESVAVHRSESAAAMRDEIARFVDDGKSEDEIVAFYVAKYGERILLEPRGQKRTWLTVVPIAALATGGLLLAKYLRRDRPPLASEALPVASVAVPDEDLDW